MTTSYATSSARAEMSELRRLKTLLPPELQSWVMVEGTTEVNPPLLRSEEIGRDEVEIQIDLVKWEQLALDQRNLLFWHEVARIQNDTITKDGWEMAALAIGLGGAVGELVGSRRLAAHFSLDTVWFFRLATVSKKQRREKSQSGNRSR
jgi:hypothetical protein